MEEEEEERRGERGWSGECDVDERRGIRITRAARDDAWLECCHTVGVGF